MKKLKIFLIGLGLILIVYFAFFHYFPNKEEKIVINDFKEQGIEDSKVQIKENQIIIDYSQSTDFENKNELYSNWAYIFTRAGKVTSTATTVVINCKFDDGEKVKVSASKSDVDDFLNWKIKTDEFLQRIKIEPLTEGPAI